MPLTELVRRVWVIATRTYRVLPAVTLTFDEPGQKWYKRPSRMKERARRSALTLAFSILFVFGLVYAQASDDPCPLHGHDHPHGLGASIASKGVVCHCVLIFFCPSALSDSPVLSQTMEWAFFYFFDRKSSLWTHDIFHPPRFVLFFA